MIKVSLWFQHQRKLQELNVWEVHIKHMRLYSKEIPKSNQNQWDESWFRICFFLHPQYLESVTDQFVQGLMSKDCVVYITLFQNPSRLMEFPNPQGPKHRSQIVSS